ncbi:MAG TPA: bifunctional UDP-sugar hydrolase/5'-nucleotidase [bacterium]|nr:bifunctional UDP-sugar hydrolase/5'-nucleotidase [bacterium]
MQERRAIREHIVFFVLCATVLSFLSCERISGIIKAEDPQRYLILYTNDEHGHMWEHDGREKAIILDEMWRDEAQKCPDCIVIKISGGDNYTGSAVSSIFKGRSMAEAMAEIGYEVSAVGNHEFDYGITEFEQNRAASKMRYVSANIIGKDTKPVFSPSETIERGGSRISFIGVTTEELRQVSFSAYLKDIKTVQAFNAVQREMRRLHGQTDVVIAIAHQSFESAREWFAALEPEDRPLLVFNAHTHEEYVRDVEGTYFVQAKKYLEKYARVELLRKKGKFEVIDAKLVTLQDAATSKDTRTLALRSLINRYLVKMDQVAGTVVIEAENDFPVEKFMKLFTCAALAEYPDADVALSNPGAFRDLIRRGEIKVSDLISMLPFENRVVLSTIPGKDLIYNLNLSENAVCGMERVNDRWHKGGAPLDPDQRYQAVIHEYVFAGGDYYKFVGPGITNQMTGKVWRAPLIKYLGSEGKHGATLEMAYNDLMKEYGYK